MFFLLPSPGQESEEDVEADLQQVTQEVPIDRSAEKPPSYDVAVVKPPPYDLQFHLTPKEHHSCPPNKSQHCLNASRLSVPAMVPREDWTLANNIDDSENDVLPSYHDALKLSLHSYGDGSNQRNSEPS